MIQRFLDHYFRTHPVNATFTGVHDHDGELPDWSPDGLDEQVTQLRSLRADCDRTKAVGSDDALLRACLDVQIAEFESDHLFRRNPSLHLGEAIFGIVALMLRGATSPDERARGIVARLRAWPAFFTNAKATLDGPGFPRLWRERALRECEGARLLLDSGLERWVPDSSIDAGTGTSISNAADLAGRALADFSQWLAGHHEVGSAPSCGSELLDILLSTGHQCPETRADLLEEARQSLMDGNETLREMIRDVGAANMEDVGRRLRALHPTPETYVESFQSAWQACRDLAIRRKLVTWPEYPIAYKQMPAWARAAAPKLYFLYYRSPIPNASEFPVEYHVPWLAEDPYEVREQLATINTSVIKLNHVVHHGAIGHHVQNYYAYQCASPLARVGAIDGASRISFFSAGTMAEGWACYATDLMEEYDFFTPLEQIAQQANRVKQLARAIVDLELHQDSVTADEAIDGFADWTNASRETATREVTKISMFPGTGMMYWYGTRALHALRRHVSAVLGSSFSLLDFHDTVLSHGSIPVPTIAQRVKGAIT